MSWKTREPNSIEPFNPRNFSSKPFVIETARSALILLKLTPICKYSCIWLTLQFSCSAIITLLRNINLNPTLPTAVSDLTLVDPMLGMFCKLASRHVNACSNRNLGDGQKIERSGIIIELMRMRDFCFVLRDRAKAALDCALSRTGEANGAAEVSSNPEYTQSHDNSAKMTVPKSSNSNEEHRTDFTPAFGATFAKPIEATISHSTQPNLSIMETTLTDPIPSTTAEETQKLQDPSLHENNSLGGHIAFERSLENMIGHQVVESQEFTVQEESGLWNWWDLIEIDIDGNPQIV